MAGPRVVVVGAGPAGAATALLLARNGIDVTLLERAADFDRAFRGEGLMPTGLDALHQMGLGDALATAPSRVLDAWEIHLDGELIMRVEEPSTALGDRALRVLSQPRLLELLVSRAAEHPHFELRMGHALRDLVRDDAGCLRAVRVATPGGEHELPANLVIGADGRASTVRKRAGLELTLLPESYDVLWWKAPLPTELKGRCAVQIFASGPDALLAYVSWDERWQLAWMMTKGGWREAQQRDWVGEAASLMPESLANHLLASREAFEGPAVLDVVVGRCASWHAPGVLLMGDAAHPMSPVRAQGINMALRDAIVAANHLVPALRADDDVSVALEAAQREREREIVRVQTLQLREVRGQRWARERPWLMAPMLKLAPLLARRGWIQRSWLRQQRELRFGVTPVELRV